MKTFNKHAVWLLSVLICFNFSHCDEEIDPCFFNTPLPTNPSILPNFHDCFSTELDIVYKYEYPINAVTGEDLTDKTLVKFWDIYASIPPGVEFTEASFTVTDPVSSFPSYATIFASAYSSTPFIISGSTSTAIWSNEPPYNSSSDLNFVSGCAQYYEAYYDLRVNYPAKIQAYQNSLVSTQLAPWPPTGGRTKIGTLITYALFGGAQEVLTIDWNSRIPPKEPLSVCDPSTVDLIRTKDQIGYYIPKLVLENVIQNNTDEELLLTVSTNDIIVFPDFNSASSTNNTEELFFYPETTLFFATLTKLQNSEIENLGMPPGSCYGYAGPISEIYDNSFNSHFAFEEDLDSKSIQKCDPIKALSYEELSLEPDTWYALYLNYRSSEQDVLSNIIYFQTDPG